jgi:hypothetical protein
VLAIVVNEKKKSVEFDDALKYIPPKQNSGYVTWMFVVVYGTRRYIPWVCEVKRVLC